MMSLGLVQLLNTKKFLPIFITQFFAAFNDNAFKLAMLTLISYQLTKSQGQSEYYQALAGTLFILPFFLLSATSGQLADKYDKAFLTRLIKVFELILMIIGSFALYYESLPLLMIILTGMGIHSTFFGPIKYAILHDLLPEDDLLGATGLIQSSTFIAILLGTTLGTLSIGAKPSIPYAAMIMTLSAAVIGLISSLFVPSVASSCSDLRVDSNIVRATKVMLQQAYSSKDIFLVIITISWFWLLGVVMMTKMPDYVHYVLDANTKIFAVFLLLFSVGIALGSIVIKSILKNNNRLSVVPWFMFAFSVFTADLYWVSPKSPVTGSLIGFDVFFYSFSHWRIAIDLFLLSFCGGLFVVPLYTYLQVASSTENRARTIASNNIYNALFMVLGTVLLMILLHWNLSIPEIFLILAITNVLVAIYLKYRISKL